MTSTDKREAQQREKDRGPAKPLPSPAEHHHPWLQTSTKNWEQWPTKAVRVFQCEPQPGEIAYATPEEQKILERQQARLPEVGLPFIAVEVDPGPSPAIETPPRSPSGDEGEAAPASEQT